MVQQYLAEFTGHLVRERPDDFPPVIKDYQMFEARNNQEVAANINACTARYMLGMAVFLDPNALVDTTKIQARVFVPMHMITHLTCKVKPLTAGTAINQEGGVHFEDGKEVPMQ